MPRRRGFTIVELLVTIGVLVLLAAIGFPAFTGIRRSQRNKRVANAITTLSVAIENYQNDYGVFPPADPPTTVVADGPNKGNRALVHWFKAGEAAGGRSAPYLPSAYYDDDKQIDGDVLLDEWERPYIYFDTASMKAGFSHPYDLRGGQTAVSPARNETAKTYCNFVRFQLWSCGANETNDGGPYADIERNDDIGNFARED